MTPKVSIIVPCWSVEKYLDRCVESLVNQTLKDIEIILVDDVSPDRVPEMCDQWAKKDARIKVVHKQNNEGLAFACNSGIEVASGEYIAFCDSDDWVELSCYEEMYKSANQHNADIVFSGIQTINDAGVVRPMNQAKQFAVMKGKKEILSYGMEIIANKPSARLERSVAMSAKIVLYRLENIKNNNLRFESERKLISEDLIWNLDNLAVANCIVTLPKTFYYYYENSSSLTHTVRKDRFPFYKSLWMELSCRTIRLGYPEEAQVRIDRMFIGYARHRIVQLYKSGTQGTDLNNQLEEVCKDEILKKVIDGYPQNKMNFVHRVFLLAIRYELYTILKILCKF